MFRVWCWAEKATFPLSLRLSVCCKGHVAHPFVLPCVSVQSGPFSVMRARTRNERVFWWAKQNCGDGLG